MVNGPTPVDKQVTLAELGLVGTDWRGPLVLSSLRSQTALSPRQPPQHACVINPTPYTNTAAPPVLSTRESERVAHGRR